MTELRRIWVDDDGTVRADFDVRVEPGTTEAELRTIVNDLIANATLPPGSSERDMRLLQIVRGTIEVHPRKVFNGAGRPVLEGTFDVPGAPETP